jgi:hypothetical protein
LKTQRDWSAAAGAASAAGAALAAVGANTLSSAAIIAMEPSDASDLRQRIPLLT